MIDHRKLAVLAPALLLAGCLSFGSEPPDSLLTLTPSATAPAGTGGSSASGSAIALVEFQAPAAIDVTRVPVQVSDTEIAYLKEAVWVEKPARLFRRLIAETIRTRSNRVVVDGDDPGALASNRLTGTLRQFGYDARTGSVVVVFDAVRPGEGSAVETRRFEATVPGVAADVRSVGPALNSAANDVAGQVADWVS
ncbi:ABC-type transport auxiliary lipoprotein family protein [Qipengyuania sp. 1NDW9]|uniref:Membrane integrity-associated transporter subunit PqiC n=1 Tax=Qipengyuania aquimaris TaxID=255984 RepID=A0A9Q3XE62_9SPHN|nr:MULTISPECIES: ABC-type transport auxiliary lipoprotein family protein [Qipengyuania]MBX7492267.1 ABC-type transport auxiliary lipoprotein family protein [Qipengyuania xiapuensis]MBY6127926.1 membrane integrity-associated transporter subunit PqiC [Qipengyuania aquimaris]MBY6218560.1 membrane integrity-associated transporter subunit PqiC [Qipengyuania aquimaris]UOR15634.1 ABC-type transport auxiliary lipoprotein family protein [Qipengyuania aquimaris]